MSIDQRSPGQQVGRPTDGSFGAPAQPRERKFELSVPQIVAGALAAASAAVASSWLGVAGTVVGAAIVSVIASVASALYKHPLERSSRVLLETIPARPMRYRLADEAVGTTILPPGELTLFDLPELSAQAPLAESSGQQEPAVPAPARERRRIHWGAVAVSSLTTLIGAFAVLTGLEVVMGKPVSGADGPGTTTIIRVIERGSSDTTTEKQPAPVQDQPTTTQPTESTTPTEPTQTQPTQTSRTTTAPTEPTTTSPTTSSTAPTTTDPALTQ